MSWSEPVDSAQVLIYIAYLEEVCKSLCRKSQALLGADVAKGINEFEIPADTATDSKTHVTVFTKSALVEQTTPAALPLVDSSATVPAIGFTDLD